MILYSFVYSMDYWYYDNDGIPLMYQQGSLFRNMDSINQRARSKEKSTVYIAKSKTPDRICMDITTISTVLKKDKQPKT